jgi:hypothetical protein
VRLTFGGRTRYDSNVRPTRLLAIALVAACSRAATSPTPESTAAHEPAPATETPTEAPATSPAADIRVVARILEQGPLGHGDCTQRSYRVEIVSTTGGEQLPSPSWVHFEQCGGPPAFDASNLEIGGTFRLVLVRGASGNFGNEPMIVEGAREP